MFIIFDLNWTKAAFCQIYNKQRYSMKVYIVEKILKMVYFLDMKNNTMNITAISTS